MSNTPQKLKMNNMGMAKSPQIPQTPNSDQTSEISSSINSNSYTTPTISKTDRTGTPSPIKTDSKILGQLTPFSSQRYEKKYQNVSLDPNDNKNVEIVSLDNEFSLRHNTDLMICKQWIENMSRTSEFKKYKGSSNATTEDTYIQRETYLAIEVEGKKHKVPIKLNDDEAKLKSISDYQKQLHIIHKWEFENRDLLDDAFVDNVINNDNSSPLKNDIQKGDNFLIMADNFDPEAIVYSDNLSCEQNDKAMLNEIGQDLNNEKFSEIECDEIQKNFMLEIDNTKTPQLDIAIDQLNNFDLYEEDGDIKASKFDRPQSAKEEVQSFNKENYEQFEQFIDDVFLKSQGGHSRNSSTQTLGINFNTKNVNSTNEETYLLQNSKILGTLMILNNMPKR